MSTAEPQPRKALVSFELETDELALGRLIDTAEDFFTLVREVATAVIPSGDVHWVVDALSMASPVHLAVRPVSDRPDVTPKALSDLADTIVSGIAAVQGAPQRPAHFSDRALERARRLATETTSKSTRLRFRSPARQRPITLTPQLVANVDSILGQTVSAIGTVEGRLEAFNVHGTNRYFNVYDALTGERVRCDFAHRIEVTEIGAAAERRVAVHGQIEYRQSGEIVRVTAQSLELFPEEEELPPPEAARGVLEG